MTCPLADDLLDPDEIARHSVHRSGSWQLHSCTRLDRTADAQCHVLSVVLG